MPDRALGHACVTLPTPAATWWLQRPRPWLNTGMRSGLRLTSKHGTRQDAWTHRRSPERHSRTSRKVKEPTRPPRTRGPSPRRCVLCAQSSGEGRGPLMPGVHGMSPSGPGTARRRSHGKIVLRVAWREHEIRGRAYELYLARGAQPGRDLEDWLQAERELTAE